MIYGCIHSTLRFIVVMPRIASAQCKDHFSAVWHSAGVVFVPFQILRRGKGLKNHSASKMLQFSFSLEQPCVFVSCNLDFMFSGSLCGSTYFSSPWPALQILNINFK